LTTESKPVKLILKTLGEEDVQRYCKTDDPTHAQVETIIDDWIYIAPTSHHITKAYAVYRDEGSNNKKTFMQLTQFKESYDNVFSHIKMMNVGSMVRSVPESLHKMSFVFAMQIS